MKKMIGLLAIVLSMGAGVSSAATLVDDHISLCTNGGVKKPGNCHFWTFWGSFSPKPMCYQGNFYETLQGSCLVSFPGSTQINVAVQEGGTCTETNTQYFAYTAPLAQCLWAPFNVNYTLTY